MLNQQRTTLIHVLQVVLALASIYYVTAFLVTVLMRIGYPFELEWLEGGIAEHVQRAANSQQIYVKPSLDFVPFIYPPLFYYISALVDFTVAEPVYAMRLVSVFSTIGTFLFLYLIVRGHARSRTAAFAAVGFFAACYGLTDGWYDIGRVDSLANFLIVGGIFCADRVRSGPGSILAGILLAASVLTKQIALLPCVAIIIYLLYRYPRSGIFTALGFACLLVGTSLFLQYSSGGWFLYYTVVLPLHHSIEILPLLTFWTQDIFPFMIVAFIFSMAIVFIVKAQPVQHRDFLLPLFVAAMILASWLGRLHSGGFVNVLMPACVAFAVGFGLAVDWIVTSAPLKNERVALLLVLAMIQLSILFYVPSHLIPKAADKAAGMRLLDGLTQISGEVLMPFHPGYVRQAGKMPHAHKMAIQDILRGDSLRGGMLRKEIADAIIQRRFALIATDAVWFSEAIQQGDYTFGGGIFDNDSVFYPVTGFRTRPRYFFVSEAGL